ncbi:MAG: MCP four helix bundle domain-containing protein [Alphaproteobacteria bacterium]|nr:MCP four helix bundle domain-containing protein [Alphaproteobacteria bacterium]
MSPISGNMTIGVLFDNMKIVSKIALAVTLLGIVAVAVAGYGLMNMSDINRRLRFLTGTAAERVRLSGEIRTTVEAIGRDEKNMILAIDQMAVDAIAASIKQRRDHLGELTAQLAPIVPAGSQEAFDQFENLVAKYLAANDRIQSLAKANTDVIASRLSRRDGDGALMTALAPLADLAKAVDGSGDDQKTHSVFSPTS